MTERIAIVTGSARGIGAATARRLAADGMAVAVLDLDEAACAETVKEIIDDGGHALAVAADVSDLPQVQAAVERVAAELGEPTVLVNNAGVIRDKMLFNMTDEDWDLVIRIHLRGHFLLTRNAAAYWRTRAKHAGGQTYGRLVNTSSEAGLAGPVGQANYGAAKAGITALTLSAARALGRYGVCANAICPRARTAMTAEVFGDTPELADGEIDTLSPDHVVTLVRFLASPAAEPVNGQVFIVYGSSVTLVAAPTAEHRFTADGPAWAPQELSSAMQKYFADRDPDQTFAATRLMGG